MPVIALALRFSKDASVGHELNTGILCDARTRVRVKPVAPKHLVWHDTAVNVRFDASPTYGEIAPFMRNQVIDAERGVCPETQVRSLR
jgi:hypothetical protein